MRTLVHIDAPGIAAALLLALLCLSTAGVHADEPAKGAVEFPVWNRTWVGALGNKQVEVTLSRVADGLSGRYCYQPCSDRTRYRLELRGHMQGARAELTERDALHTAKSTGSWHIASLEERITGTWRSPDGKRTLPLDLLQVKSALYTRLPFESHLLANKLPEDDGAGCPEAPVVSGIRLYKDGKPVQTLETESQGTCGLFLPKLIDANFDGWPDLSIAQFLPAGPNVPHQTWLYDPKTERFVDAPPGLQDITSAEFDPDHQIIYSYWRSNCCEHGVTTYRWQGNDVEEVDNQSSYFLPIMEGDTRRTCYIEATYRDGFIEYPRRIEQAVNGQLTLHGIDPKSCDPDMGAFLDRTHIDIWKPAQPGQQPTHLRTEKVEWIETNTTEGPRYCPSMPYYEKGHIRRVLLSENANLCLEQRPEQ